LILAAIPVAEGPFPPVEGFGSLWVASNRADVVTRIDPASNKVIAEVPVGPLPGRAIAAYGSVWVPDYAESTISRIDPATDTATRIDTGAGPTCGAPTAAAGLLWIRNCDAGTIAGIDPATSTLEQTLDVRGFTFGNGRDLWIARGETIARIDPKTGNALLTIDVGPEPRATADSFEGNRLWVSSASGFDGAVARIDLSTGAVEEVGSVGPDPEAPVVEGDRVLVYSTATGAVSVVDIPSNEVALRPTRLPPIAALSLAVAFGSLWLADFETNFVYRLDLP
jgi:YVTN family beta-propeller protein